ncbi:MAG TPA: hypothetical protein ENK85_09690 [Saprospiraceae bacterium]|nr:hypothetical protein [Saprospiraceae bacterium]
MSKGHHHGKLVKWLNFSGWQDLLARTKTLNGILFFLSQRFWHLPNTNKTKREFFTSQIPFLSGTHESVQKGSPINESALNHDETGISSLTARESVIPSTDKKDTDIHDSAQSAVSWTGKGFLLEGTRVGTPYRTSSVTAIIKKAQ